ncbi:hypothetical protein [Enterococcus saccharolyticus]|uniref:Uncharacterized protein n=1 Tax=Enterococcus saccharolyticus subsp. saccharolyticus ATCC 43076 TaxID=1139996 RepID=S0JE39_9ENTE|nr:hypothetical protein [Enterococcus saccharolyticus]EOT30527.1 hypothetical protein OMQ_00231 [Enterococcus saccharolyticus subsp. saccharolyticus ATCC 43076]EOT80088.1 hypothetical protein I572_00613 [Enterococcus saccharolyticus subsp. saccharolyticus ATCC 43076]OJG87899.1 hypothetical protein RV16_GL000420 [Enterococcus saccharolyticus]
MAISISLENAIYLLKYCQIKPKLTNFGIALGSAAGSLLVKHVGLNSVGPGGAIFTVITLILLLLLIRSTKKR